MHIHIKSHLAVLILILTLAATTVESQTILRFATVAPEGFAWMDAMHAIDDDLQNASGGEVKFKFYPNMSMGDEKDVVRKMRFGQIDAAGFTGFGLGEILPEVRVLELPYLFRNNDEVDYVADRMFEYFNSRLKEKGFVLLGWAHVGWVYFFSNKPVAEPSDLAGTKAWMWLGDPLAQAFFRVLDKNPIPLSLTDVLLSLQTGHIDAAYCTPLAALALQWFTEVTYISQFPFTHSVGAVLISKGSYDKLPEVTQNQLIESSNKQLKILIDRTRMENQESISVILAEGVQKYPASKEQQEKMFKVGNDVKSKLKDDLYPGELINKIEDLLSDYRSTHPETSSDTLK